MTKRNQSGFGIVEALLVLVAIGILGFTGWYVYHAKQSSDKNYTATNSSAPAYKKKSVKSATQAAFDPYAGWSQYCSTLEKSCFKYPAAWTTKNIGAADPVADGIQLTSPSGTTLTFQSEVDGLGGACDPSTNPHVFIDKVIPRPHVSNLYIVEEGIGASGTVDRIGLVNTEFGASRPDTGSKPPTVGDTGACLVYMTFQTHHDPSADAWFQGYVKQNDLSTAEQILESYAY